MHSELTIIGGGLAGSEAAWQAAERGLRVDLFEMRPRRSTEAHVGADLAELVCSNSLGSDVADRPSGLLKAELRRMGSLLLECADATAVPAGSALAVDREAFAARVTERLQAHPNIDIRREEITDLPGGPAVIASGLLAGWNAARLLHDQRPLVLPTETMLGALCHYVSHADIADFQPMKSNMGLLPPLPPPEGRRKKRGKRERQGMHAERALASLEAFLERADPLARRARGPGPRAREASL